MSPELTTILMILSLLVLLAGFPLAFGVGTVGVFFGLLTTGPGFMYMIAPRVMDGILSAYILAAVPLFIFMGNMMQASGVAEKAFRILHRWMGGMNGGLAVATVLLAMILPRQPAWWAHPRLPSDCWRSLQCLRPGIQNPLPADVCAQAAPLGF